MGILSKLCLICFFCSLYGLRSVVSLFIPEDRLFISCGVNNEIELEDGRLFEPDLGNSNVDFSAKSNSIVSNPELSIPIVYRSARVFTGTAKFTININQVGRHWLRLHFYPVENDKYDLKSALFSVVANGITLLHGFSFSKLENSSPLLKEYVIEIGGSSSEKLVLTFSPWSTSSVAFINGIEVVSVPDGQFDFSVIPIPSRPEFVIPTHVALETVYRINVGGSLLTPKNDSLGRIWIPDWPFLLNAASARNVSEDPRWIKYPAGASVEIAPNWVYATAQEMADANVTEQKFNMTWSFGVERGFNYFVRLHFCDIVSKALNTLIFNVYINNHSAIDTFDISSKTMELSAAYFVDFVLNGSTVSDQILVQVGSANQRNFPSNAILNGLEIMKMSSSTDSLDERFTAMPLSSKVVPKRKRHVLLITLVSVGAFVVLLLIIAAIFFAFSSQKKKPKQYRAWLSFQLGISDTKISANSFASTAASLGLGRVLAFSEIRDSTKDFDESLVIGVGGFGKVYKGVLDNGDEVAVKRGNPKSQQGLLEFRTEIEMLSKLRHRHLVSLIGYCEELNEMILVYEFMAGGPLRKHLYGSGLPPLSWKRRLEICIGAAKGLHYLHTGAAEIIIHRDVKTTNILLDENFTAKVADFGLSKLGPTLDQTHVSTAVKGSFGYLDPEYYRRQQLTEKSDVYSFGVVLLEVLCARPAINPSLPREQVNIAEWAMHWQKKGQLHRIIDPHLVSSISMDSLRKFGETAEKCLAEYGSDRPTMGDVLWNLEYALQLQEASTQSIIEDNSANHIPEIPGWIARVESVDSDDIDVVSTQEYDATNSTGVFSQLMNPRGR
ncbi:OLC1v1027710C1 [Oldenlandia corymbosa var. corymbosa]|uniref:OLC1v1027710C1 n=1 Tax=Oldenlandia corymbosa var. corymbosa TaxID=529605 RepID=A0AAV1CA32_OLDCO|nr:OLC1v1027710C1 [Oldenlandia corymbosa var. corymbosa]